MLRVLILSFSPIRVDPRVMRQVDALKADYSLTLAGFGPPPDGVIFHDISAAPVRFLGRAKKAILLFFRFYEIYYWRMSWVRNAMTALQDQRFDAVIANDVVSLPLALKLAHGKPVLIDAHEYSPREFEDLLLWRLSFGGFFQHLCRKYLRKASSMTTVCQGIADEYLRHFGVKSSVVLNCPAAQPLSALPVNQSQIQLVHHGASIRSRKLELMIEMMHYLDARYTLDLMLVNSNPQYMRELKELASNDSRITFHEPVPMEQISATINKYDIGVFLLPPVNFNYEFALPNKFFEFVQARLAVAIGPSPEMARILHKYGFGIVSQTFEAKDLAEQIGRLDVGAINAMKRNADLASREFNSDQAAAFLRSELARLTQIN